MKQIVSNNHFKRLLRQFKKISYSQIKKNKYLTNEEIILISKLYHPQQPPYDLISNTSPYDLISNILLNNYKQNPYKTHSSIDDVIYSEYINKFWISYTIEDENGRYFGFDFINKKIIFRIYMKYGQYRKKRIAKWEINLKRT